MSSSYAVSKGVYPQVLIQKNCASAIQTGDYKTAVRYFKQALQKKSPPFCRVFRLIINGLVVGGYIKQLDVSTDINESGNLSQSYRKSLKRLNEKNLIEVFKAMHDYSEKHQTFSESELGQYFRTVLN